MTQRDYDCFFGRKHGFDRAGLLTRRATPYAFSTQKNRQTNRNQSVINTENNEKKKYLKFRALENTTYE